MCGMSVGPRAICHVDLALFQNIESNRKENTGARSSSCWLLVLVLVLTPKHPRLMSTKTKGRRLSGWKAEDAQNLIEENDDESERVAAARQKSEEAERLAQKARSPFKETPNRKARTAVLTDMYSDAIQMCAENVRRRPPTLSPERAAHSWRHATPENQREEHLGARPD